MNCDIKFDPKRDLSEPSQTGFVDLVDLVSHGVIPEGLNITEDAFNNIEDPKSIIGRPEDQFHAMHLGKEIGKRAELAQKASDAILNRKQVDNSQS